MCDEEVSTIVIDNGSCSVKAGFAGEDAPLVTVPSMVGRLRPSLQVATGTNDLYVGDDAQRICKNLVMSFPIQCGLVTDWDDMEQIWHHLFYNQLRVAPEEHPILLTEATLNPTANREKMAQIMFEKFSCPSISIALQAKLALYSVGEMTGLVLDSGYQATHIVPIYDSCVISKGITRLNFGGEDLTDYLIKILMEYGEMLTSTSERPMANEIKEKYCYVEKEFENAIEMGSAPDCLQKNYEHPEGRTIRFDTQRFRCPEALFRPSFLEKQSVGVHQAVFDSIMKCDVRHQNEMFSNIVLSGGSTKFPGFVDRLEKELLILHPGSVKIKVDASTDRRNSVWVGGSIFASLQAFKTYLTSKADYEENGAFVVNHDRSGR